MKMNQYKEDKTAEYESLIAELRKQLENEEYGSGLREKVIEKMQAEIQEAGTLCKGMNSELVNLRIENENMKAKIENTDSDYLNAACEDVENEIATLREEKEKLLDQCSKLLDKQYKDDYRIENLKNRVDFFAKEAERFEKENKALRELVKLWS
jgi:chromosome segregation ATPase